MGNCTSGERFCEVLRPFWGDLLNDIEGGPLDFEHIIVFTEDEQSEAPVALQIGWDDETSPDRKISIERFNGLPFTWMQH